MFRPLVISAICCLVLHGSKADPRFSVQTSFQTRQIQTVVSRQDADAKRTETNVCPETGQPSVWIDNAPDCQADSTYCHQFGLDYVCSNTISTQTNVCFQGTQVKCTPPAAPTIAEPTPANVLKIISYNILDVPYIVAQNGQRERTCRIPVEILKSQPDVDVIVFQEVFNGGCIVNDDDTTSLTLRQMLREYGFTYFTENVAGGALLIEPKLANGGVFIASRWPIVTEAQKVFENYDRATFYESLIAKGVMYAKVVKSVAGTSKSYHIFGTHLQSSELSTSQQIRLLQAHEVFDFMEAMLISTDEPVIYAGDLNGNLVGKREHTLAIMDILQATMPVLTGTLQVTYDYHDNDNIEGPDPAEFLDYVLFSRSHETPIYSTLAVFRPLSPAAIEICKGDILYGAFMYPQSPDCPGLKTVRDLSDHYAVVALLGYSSE